MEVLLPYPLSVNRYWTINARLRRIVPTPEGTRWKKAARFLALAQLGGGAQPFLCPVTVCVRLAPRATAKGKASAVRPDLDNVLKVALDSVQGILYVNDKQIVRLEIDLMDAPMPTRPEGALVVSARPKEQGK